MDKTRLVGMVLKFTVQKRRGEISFLPRVFDEEVLVAHIKRAPGLVPSEVWNFKVERWNQRKHQDAQGRIIIDLDGELAGRHEETILRYDAAAKQIITETWSGERLVSEKRTDGALSLSSTNYLDPTKEVVVTIRKVIYGGKVIDTQRIKETPIKAYLRERLGFMKELQAELIGKESGRFIPYNDLMPEELLSG
ncbi:MAG: hypothetical protein HYT94_03075 [Parcubacteria group bacterium]|nr:hypothetical protein [Parcubacteria group bacterium]